ncbi:flavin reductase family protein [Streptomyces sp. NPDC050636]|uniref:flavin reductase family protein n=1 Tax=Streptomyces sp. NPDC050636 TaxID=3154510 RepID=UPI00343E1BE8
MPRSNTETENRPQDFDSQDFRRVLGNFCSGLTVITAMDGDTPVGLACQSFSSLSLEPPMVAFFVGKKSTSWPRIARSGAFCVNVLQVEQEQLCERFARSGGEKFRGVRWTGSPHGLPHLDGSLAWIDCAIEEVHSAGDHHIVVGSVRLLEARSEGSPLLFFRGGFGQFI